MSEQTAQPYFTRQIVVASGNRNKILELQTVGRRFGLELLSPQDLAEEGLLPPWPDVHETGQTYHDNALLKAQAFAAWAGLPALGDDSGLEVAALDNQPGVRSARYAGEGASDKVRIQKLLHDFHRLAKHQPRIDRRAYFRCHLVLAYPNGALLTADAVLKGEVLDEPRGDMGFGYDPIILIEELGHTLAEVDFQVTCEKGFRAKAAEQLFPQLLALNTA